MKNKLNESESRLYQQADEFRRRAASLTERLKIPSDATGNKLFLEKSRESLDFYSSDIFLKDPSFLVNFYFEVLRLPPDLAESSKRLVEFILAELRQTAKVSLDTATGKLMLAEFPITSLSAEHRKLLGHLISLAPGTVVTAEDLVPILFDGDARDSSNKDSVPTDGEIEPDSEEDASSNKPKKKTKAPLTPRQQKNEVIHQLATLDVLLRKLNLNQRLSLPPVFPLRIVGKQIEVLEENGQVTEAYWGNSLTSDFVLPDPQHPEEEKVSDLLKATLKKLFAEDDFDAPEVDIDTLDTKGLVKVFVALKRSALFANAEARAAKREIEKLLVGEAQLSFDFEKKSFGLEEDTLDYLEPEEVIILKVLLKAPANTQVPVKEIAFELQEKISTTWERLGPLEELLRATSQRYFSKNVQLLSLNIAAHPIKTASGMDPAIPTLFLTSSFVIPRDN